MNRIESKGISHCIFTLLLLAVALLSSYSLSFAGPTNGNVIMAIDVKGLSRIKTEELTDMMCFRAGDTFDKDILKKCIRNAFKKGIFLDIRVDSESFGEGLKLTYIVTEFPLINDIVIKGNENISNGEVRKAIAFFEGDDFREELLEKAEMNIVSLYERKGFYDSAVKISARVTKSASMVDLNINIDEGTPRRIKSIDMPDDALGRVNIYVNDIFDRDKIDKELDKLKTYYIKNGYVNPQIGPYELKEGALYVPVNPGAILKVKFQENTVFSDKALLKEMPFKDSQTVSDELIEEASSRIRELYYAKGYYYVQVAAGLETSDDLINITFIIFEGKKVTIGNVDFQGVSMDKEILKGIIQLREQGPYNDDLFSKSINSLESFYNALGYINMKVVDTIKEFESDGSIVNLTYEISEGGQVRIKKLDINGNRGIASTEIRNTISLLVNAPFNLFDIRDARYRVLSLYKRYGYIDASVEIVSNIDEDGASIQFNINENNPSVLGKVIVRGNRKTKEKIIRREFTLNEGAPYNYDELLKIKQRIYRLGLFNEVSIDELASDKLPDKTVKDVLVSLKEDKAGSFEVSLGYGDYEQFRGALDLSYRNIGGYNRQIGLRGEISSLERKYIIDYVEPWFFNKRDLPLRASLIKEGRRNINIDTKDILFEIDKLSVIAGVEKELVTGLKFNLNYEYSVNETSNVQSGVILGRDDTGTLAIGSISTSLFYDTRNNPFDPSKGSLNGVVLKFASKAFLSEVEFIKSTFQSSWYFALPKALVFASSFRGGVSYSYEEYDELPLVERFFLGGRTTVRGYSHDTLGPKGIENAPTGGNIYALINEELRVPVGKGVGLVVFLDGGNVWQTAGDVDGKLKFTAGGGLRYITPVGPVRIDYGHKLDRDAGESPGELHFSFGHAF